MKKIIIALLVLISHATMAQLSTSLSQNKPKTIIQDGNCRIQFIDSTGTQVHEMLCSQLKFWYEKSYPYFGGKKITIFDGYNKIYIENDGSLTSPTFANLDDSLNVWKQCEVGGTGTDPIDYSGKLDTIITLLTDSLDKNIFIENDSIRVWFNNPLDTSNQGILKDIYDVLSDSLKTNITITNDSLKVWFSQPIETKSDTANKSILEAIYNVLVDSLDKDIYINNDSIRVFFADKQFVSDTANQFILSEIHNLLVDSLDKNIYVNNDSIRVFFNDVLDTSNAGILNAIYNQLVDSLDKQLYVLNPYIDSAIVRRMDTIIDRLSVEKTQDTLKSLVFTAVAKVRTDRDTLFNCKSISFGRKSTASGTLVLTYENGESESFDVANDDLPAWVNGEFISYLDYNATGAVGLIVNTLGCSQTDSEICAKIKPIFDCELVVPITCNGWQSGSGIWSTLSGCWNTGQ